MDLAAPKFNFCSSPGSGLKSDIGPCPFRADTVEKVFSGWRTKFFRTADAVRTRRREGPHRFTQKRPRTFVLGLASIAAVETSKHRLSRDFQRRSIFDFCNNIGTNRTSSDVRLESALRGKADSMCSERVFRFLTHLRHWPVSHVAAAKLVSAPINVLV